MLMRNICIYIYLVCIIIYMPMRNIVIIIPYAASYMAMRNIVIGLFPGTHHNMPTWIILIMYWMPYIDASYICQCGLSISRYIDIIWRIIYGDVYIFIKAFPIPHHICQCGTGLSPKLFCPSAALTKC